MTSLIKKNKYNGRLCRSENMELKGIYFYFDIYKTRYNIITSYSGTMGGKIDTHFT